MVKLGFGEIELIYCLKRSFIVTSIAFFIFKIVLV